MDRKPLRGEKPWVNRLARSGFFVGAVLFHLVIFLIVGTWIVMQSPPKLEEFAIHPSLPPKPADTLPPHDPTPLTPNVDLSGATSSRLITMEGPSQGFQMKLDSPDLGQVDKHAERVSNLVTRKNSEEDPSRKQNFQHMVRDMWGVDPTDPDTHDPKAKFVVYVAAYANGDWACNTVIDKDGKITGGAIPDLLEKIKEWTHGRTQGEIITTPLRIGSPDLLEKMPPFVFFTGHKDFVLTDQEVENLQNYLQNGGAIWGDNALPGEGSRFDVAFRREMKRVISDKDKNFEPLPLTHDIFTKREFVLSKIPVGMNYYDEPIEHIDIGGKIAILYTPNDYSDVLFLRILPGDKQADLTYPYRAPLHTNMDMWGQHETFFRNFSLESSLGAHRLGMNIVTYLLTRFNDE